MKRLVIILSVLGAFILGVYVRGAIQPTPVSVAIAATPAPTPKVCYSDTIPPNEIIRIQNLERAKAGLVQLVENNQLTVAAQLKANDLITRHYWAHHLPGESSWTAFSEVGYPYFLAGENLAEAFSTPQGVITGWLNSPEHRENVLKPGYREVGVAVVCGVTDKNTTLIVAEYGSR